MFTQGFFRRESSNEKQGLFVTINMRYSISEFKMRKVSLRLFSFCQHSTHLMGYFRTVHHFDTSKIPVTVIHGSPSRGLRRVLWYTCILSSLRTFDSSRATVRGRFNTLRSRVWYSVLAHVVITTLWHHSCYYYPCSPGPISFHETSLGSIQPRLHVLRSEANLVDKSCNKTHRVRRGNQTLSAFAVSAFCSVTWSCYSTVMSDEINSQQNPQTPKPNSTRDKNPH